MNIPYVMKKCSKCGRWLVASTVNFHKQKIGKYGLRSDCKECKKQYYEANKGKILEQKKQYGKQYREINKKKIAEANKRYRKANKEKLLEQQRQYYKDNKEKLLEQHKRYNKEYRQSLQGQVVEFNNSQRRRIKEEQQGDGITKDQWLEMMCFFNFRCAYSGEVLSKKTRSIDHIVPLNSGGEHEIWNLVPMTRSLNSSKRDKDMLEWYREQDFYSEARLAKIYEWKEHARKKWEK